jgi:hypothetical protein
MTFLVAMLLFTLLCGWLDARIDRSGKKGVK